MKGNDIRSILSEILKFLDDNYGKNENHTDPVKYVDSCFGDLSIMCNKIPFTEIDLTPILNAGLDLDYKDGENFIYNLSNFTMPAANSILGLCYFLDMYFDLCDSTQCVKGFRYTNQYMTINNLKIVQVGDGDVLVSYSISRPNENGECIVDDFKLPISVFTKHIIAEYLLHHLYLHIDTCGCTNSCYTIQCKGLSINIYKNSFIDAELTVNDGFRDRGIRIPFRTLKDFIYKIDYCMSIQANLNKCFESAVENKND